MKISLKRKERWIKSDHPSFKGTPYEGTDIEFLIQPVSRTQYAQVSEENTHMLKKGRVRTDDVNVQKDLFIRAVKDWKGLKDEDGADIPCNQETKDLLSESFLVLTSSVVEAALAEEDQILQNHEGQVKN
jgi:hypothetical protein